MMHDLTRTRVDLSLERKASHEMDPRQAPPAAPRTVHASAGRRRDWGLDRQARRRNLRLMLLLLGSAPLSRQA
jgi:hypothetical protein